MGQPGELLEPARLLGEDTTGYAEWTLRLEDPGTEQFVEGLLERTREGQEILTILPPELERPLLRCPEERDRQSLRNIFPLVAAWTLSPGDGADRDRHLFSASLQAAGNRLVLVDWILGMSFWRGGVSGDDGEFRKILYRDESIFQLSIPDQLELTFFIRGNDLFFAYDLDTARSAVDRLAPEGPPSREPTPLDDLFARIPPDRPLRGAVTNERGEILRLWRRVALRIEEPEWLTGIAAQLRGATLSGRLTGEETLEGRIGLWGPGPIWTAANTEEAVDALRAGLDYDSLRLTADAVVEGDWLQIDFHVSASAAFLQDFLELQIEGAPGASSGAD